MTGLTSPEFVEILKRSKLIDADQLTRALNACKENNAGRLPTEPVQIASDLVRANLITKWQWDKLKIGKYKGFFIGQYKLIDHLGKGGMSSVYLAEHVHMKRRVAIKVLPPSRVGESAYRERFYLEARAAAALDHPNIVRAYDVNNDSGTHYFVMEFIDGTDLQRVVRDSDGPIDVEWSADIILQAARALAHAHEAGLIHRDIKPANLLLDQQGVVKLTDLGLARFSSGETASITLAHEGNVMGTADYLAPEQALNSHEADSRADIYSLGCTFYYLLTGQAPFPTGSLAQRIAQHQSSEPQSIREFRPDCPHSLIEICGRMMCKKPIDRYQTAANVAGVIENWLGERGYTGVNRESIGQHRSTTGNSSIESGSSGKGVHRATNSDIDQKTKSFTSNGHSLARHEPLRENELLVAEPLRQDDTSSGSDVIPNQATDSIQPGDTLRILAHEPQTVAQLRRRQRRQQIRVPLWLWISLAAATVAMIALLVAVVLM